MKEYFLENEYAEISNEGMTARNPKNSTGISICGAFIIDCTDSSFVYRWVFKIIDNALGIAIGL